MGAKSLSEIRKEYLEEIRKNLESAIAIRDNPEVTDKERINAIKEINWMLGVRKPEKTDKQPTEKQLKKERELTKEELKEIENLVHAE